MHNNPVVLAVFRKLSRPGRVLLRPVIEAHRKYQKMKLSLSYHPWAFENEEECFVNNRLEGPAISVVVPAYNTPTEHLLPMVYSVVNQHYENWELVLVNGSTEQASRDRINACAKIDTRIKIVDFGENLGIAGNTNAGIESASGEYVAFLDHDDLLHPCALHCIVQEILKNKSELIYTDEDKINHQGTHYSEPHLKPMWSPQLFENVNYLNHLTVVKTDYVKGVKGLRNKLDGAQDYDLLLRIVDKYSPTISHIPRILYHWRAADSSTAKDIANKQYIFKAGERALNDHHTRKKIKAKSRVIANKPGFYETIYMNPSKVSIVVGPVEKGYERLSAWWLGELLKKEGDLTNAELLIESWYRRFAKDDIKIKYIDENNFWRNVIEKSDGEVIVCFQEAALTRKSGDIKKLASVAENIKGSFVAPIIVGKDGTIIDAGLVKSEYGLQPLFKGCKYSDSTFFGSTDWVRNVDSLTLDIFATRKENLLACGVDGIPKRRLITKDLEKETTCISWAHVVCDYNGFLANQVVQDTYFNHQLASASYEVSMKVTSKEGYHERDNGE